MNELKCKEIAALNWGSFTPEFSKDNKFIHVFNHCLSNTETVQRTIRFIIGRIQWCNMYFNNQFVHAVVIDDVGQNISNETRENIRNAIEKYVISLKFSSEEN
ncbi:MAG: hypothetical protein ACI39E_03775 [Acutalibacteraceae bacterium]